MKSVQPKRPRYRVAVFVVVALVALASDRVTKLWALSALGDGRTVTVVPRLLSLTLVRNPGASLGMGSSVTWLISCVALVACVILVYYGVKVTNLNWTVALSLAFSGALGNLIDRAIYARGFLDGKVVDFLNYGWSVGNVADIILMAAAAYIVVLICLNVSPGLNGSKPMSGEGGGAHTGEEEDVRPGEEGGARFVDGGAGDDSGAKPGHEGRTQSGDGNDDDGSETDDSGNGNAC